MGDRANVYIREDETHGVYLYTHWAGSELPEIVRQALAGGERWTDGQYLARIIFCRMLTGGTPALPDVVSAEALNSPTGFGISTQLGDNSYPIIVVDPAHQLIGFAPEPVSNGARASRVQPDPTEWTLFEDYVKRPAVWPKREVRA